MRSLTLLALALTIAAGRFSFGGNGSFSSETMKLAYAYFALMTVICAMITLTMRPSIGSFRLKAREKDTLARDE